MAEKQNIDRNNFGFFIRLESIPLKHICETSGISVCLQNDQYERNYE